MSDTELELTPEQVAIANEDHKRLAIALEACIREYAPGVLVGPGDGPPRGRTVALTMAALTDILGAVILVAGALEGNEDENYNEITHSTMMRMIGVIRVYRGLAPDDDCKHI